MIQLNKGILVPATVKEMRLHPSPEKSLLGEWGRARERRNLRPPCNMIVPGEDYFFRGRPLELVRLCLSCKRGPSVMANKYHYFLLNYLIYGVPRLDGWVIQL